MSIGATIRTARRLKNLTQSELANMCGVTQESISQIERGDRMPSDNYVECLCSNLGLSIKDFDYDLSELISRYIKGLSPKKVEKVFDYIKFLKWEEENDNDY